MAIRTEERGGDGEVTVCVCDDCGRWEHVGGGAIRHAKRCAAANVAAPAATPAGKSAAEIHTLAKRGDGLGEEEVYDAYRAGLISMSDAMNRDD